MKLPLSIVFLFSLTSLVNKTEVLAQLYQPYRFEQELEFSESGFTIISLKEEGLALVRDTDRYGQGKKKWQLEILDTTLTKMWSTEVELENRLIIVGYEYAPGHLYLLFREGESNHFGFKLVTALFHEKKILTHSIKFDLEFKITHFTMANGSAVFGGYVNNEPAVLLYNPGNDQPKVLPGLFVSDVKLLDVRTNLNQSFNVLLYEHRGRESKKLIVRTYDHDGNLLIDDVMDFDPKYSILSGLTSTLDRDEFIIAGTYGEGNYPQAMGFYTVVVDPFNQQKINYTDFSSLQHFLDYMPLRKAGKVKEKAKKEKSTGEVPDLKSYVMPFRLDESKKGFYLLAEMYVPSHGGGPYPYSNSFYNPYSYGYYPYGTSPYMNRYYNSPYSPYGNPFNNSSNSSDYRMLQSMVIKIGSQARIEADYSIKFDDVRQGQLEQVSDFVAGSDSVGIIYKKDNEIFYLKTAGEKDEQPTIKQLKITLINNAEQSKNDTKEEGVTRFWYNNDFYVWGYQTISGKEQRRHVFYINKITLE